MFQYKCDIFLSFKDNKFWKPSAVNDVRTKSFSGLFFAEQSVQYVNIGGKWKGDRQQVRK